MSDLLDFPGAMLLTHLPYWIAAVYLILAVRRARRSLEAVTRALDERRDRRS